MKIRSRLKTTTSGAPNILLRVNEVEASVRRNHVGEDTTSTIVVPAGVFCGQKIPSYPVDYSFLHGYAKRSPQGGREARAAVGRCRQGVEAAGGLFY